MASELRGYLEGIDADPARLAAVEERLEAIERLKRKHGGSVESVLAHAERCRAEIERLAGAEERGAEAEAALAEARRPGRSWASGSPRAAPAPRGRCASGSSRSWSGWRCPAPRSRWSSSRIPAASARTAPRRVELRLSPNPGIEAAPLRDAASGGELSRVMLALTGLGAAAGAGTLVFDEIDAGIGGQTARVVGERLRALGEDRQVVCITHLPQVASLAPTHFRLEKDLDAEPATATVQRLEGEGVVEEIRRMLGGESSDEAATRHAQELLAAA